jgi:hypothetical protein
MKTFISDLFPKLIRFSKKLDNITLLTKYHWVVLDELSQIIYIFKDNQELLISNNGKVERAKWEYLGQNSILIDLKDQLFLFRHGFFDENILALKIDGKDEYAVLVNENKFQEGLNSIIGIDRYLQTQYIEGSASSKVEQDRIDENMGWLFFCVIVVICTLLLYVF